MYTVPFEAGQAIGEAVAIVQVVIWAEEASELVAELGTELLGANEDNGPVTAGDVAGLPFCVAEELDGVALLATDMYGDETEDPYPAEDAARVLVEELLEASELNAELEPGVELVVLKAYGDKNDDPEPVEDIAGLVNVLACGAVEELNT